MALRLTRLASPVLGRIARTDNRPSADLQVVESRRVQVVLPEDRGPGDPVRQGTPDLRLDLRAQASRRRRWPRCSRQLAGDVAEALAIFDVRHCRHADAVVSRDAGEVFAPDESF